MKYLSIQNRIPLETNAGYIRKSTFFVQDVMVVHLDQDNISLDISPDMARELIENLQNGLNRQHADSIRVHLSGKLTIEI